MLFDTDVIIFAQQGRASAKAAIVRQPARHISLQTLLELLQTNRGKAEHRLIKIFLKEVQESYSTNANKFRIPAPELKVGDLVFLKSKFIKTQRPMKKLDHKQLGPFKILEKLSELNFRLKFS